MINLETLGNVSVLHRDSAGTLPDGTAPMITIGTGNPNGNVAGYKGQIYIDLEGTPGKVLYVKESPPFGYTKGGWQPK